MKRRLQGVFARKVRAPSSFSRNGACLQRLELRQMRSASPRSESIVVATTTPDSTMNVTPVEAKTGDSSVPDRVFVPDAVVVYSEGPSAGKFSNLCGACAWQLAI